MKILVVDDDYVSQTKLKALLSAFGDCDAVSDGEAALVEFEMAHNEAEPYDLVTVDINLPEMQGQEVVQRIRQWEDKNRTPSVKRTKVIMITMMDDKKNIFSSFEKGCEWYLVKPITPDNLATALVNIGLLEYDVSQS